jgi:hypothetical protein
VISAAEERSLDLVQRVVFSAIVTVVIGSIATVLALYLVYNREEFSRLVLLINRRRPFSPWLVLGLLPMAVSAYWVLR